MEEARRLTGLVDDLLVLARADADRLSDRQPVDLGDLVRAVVARFTTLAGRRGVRLDAAGDAVITGDPGGLERAVANLIDNALRHTPTGGRVHVEVTPRNRQAASIAVVDTGSGVAPEQLDRLFDRFHRIDGVRNRPGGAGLGLAIVAAVAAAHNGSVTVENQPEGGLRALLVLE